MSVRDRRIPIFVSDNFFRRILQPPEKKISRFVFQGQVVADLGCGPGYFSLPMARLVGPRGKVFAVDFNPRAIERVRKKASDEGLEEIVDSRVSSAADVDFIPDLSVDFVLAEGLLCCMTDHPGALRQIRRILKEGAHAYLSISKFARTSDSRSVSKEEWQRILGGFRVLESGQSLFSKWALVSRVNGETATRSEESAPTPSIHLACICN